MKPHWQTSKTFACLCLASLKSLGDKTSSLFERKKKDVEKLAHDKAAEAQKMAEEQAQKASESLMKTKNEAEGIAASTGKSFQHFPIQ